MASAHIAPTRRKPAPVQSPQDAAEDDVSGRVQAVEAAFALLRTVATAPDLGLSELARRTEVGKARAYRLLRTMEQLGMLAQAPDSTWRLGLGSLVLGEMAREQIDIARLARPILGLLSEAVGETALLRVRDGAESVCIAVWYPDRDVRAHVVMGSRRPLHIGSGKVLLAHALEDVRERVLTERLERFTDRTVTDPAALRALLARIRKDGIMVTLAELGSESGSVAAPVRSAAGAVVATIGLSVPLTRMGRAQLRPLATHTREAAARLSAALGFIPHDQPRR
jgi:DNA-binding IclR family transcriptional regulator